MWLPPRPTIFEINTAVWLERLGRARGTRLHLDEVPPAEWDALADLAVDAVWLMGVWERSPAGLEIAQQDPGSDAANRAALTDLRPRDVIGSPYCVRDYAVDERFGGSRGLASARKELAQRGVGLILDYVPNHVAPDHPWVSQRPDVFIRGTDDDLARDPDGYLRTSSGILTKGRDPYFPPWSDVVQLNAFSEELREAASQTLIGIASQCDGMRCDMAMLVTNDVFARTWGERAGPAPREEYWPRLIAQVKARYPDALFIAEAYWDMEWTLQQQGFDLCYDKRLYDRLVAEDAASIRAHLSADPAYQEGLIRFIENHDEPRAAATFTAGRARAAAVVFSTLRGARLFHDGQLEGWRTHVPVFLGRGPDEPTDHGLNDLYGRLLHALREGDLRSADWTMCDVTGWPDNDSHRHVLAWCWRAYGSRHLVVVNFSEGAAQARVHLPWDDLAKRQWSLRDLLGDATFDREGRELAAKGLYADLAPWQSALFEFR